jgi:hypothetical protein
VVSLTSAKLDQMPQVASQIVVPADHVNLHRHPESILEVRRILLEQMADLEAFPNGRRPQVAVQVDAAHNPDLVIWPEAATAAISSTNIAPAVLSR